MNINKIKFLEGYQKQFGNAILPRQENVWRVVNRATSVATIPQLAYILATAHHETGETFKPIVESLTYTTARRLMQVWPSRFKNIEFAKQYTNNPVKLGAYVYNGRLGNRTGTDDGYNYRGRGLSQLTGRENYIKWGKLLGRGDDFVNDPDLLCDKDVSVEILVRGLLEGQYSGVALKKYINENETNYVQARRCVNADVGLNGGRIATVAKKFESILRDSLDK